MFYKPMLAKTFDENKHQCVWNGEYVLEEKFDGHRFQYEKGLYRSRNGNWISLDLRLRTCAVLDGEIIVDPRLGIPTGHSDVSHWLVEDQSKLVVVLFDILVDDDSELDFVESETQLWRRREHLEELYDRIGSDRVWMAKQIEQDKKAVYDSLIDAGREGAVLKKIDSPYVPGSRGLAWVKMKSWDPIDVVITDCESTPTEWRVRPGEMDRQTGLISVDGTHTQSWLDGNVGLSYGYYDLNGQLKRVGALGWTGQREELAQYVGRVASVKTYGKVNSSGCLNHPVWLEWRDDKDASECVFSFEEGVVV